MLSRTTVLVRLLQRRVGMQRIVSTVVLLSALSFSLQACDDTPVSSGGDGGGNDSGVIPFGHDGGPPGAEGLAFTDFLTPADDGSTTDAWFSMTPPPLATAC